MAGCLVLEGVENFGEFFFKEREKRMQKDGEEREMHAEPERERGACIRDGEERDACKKVERGVTWAREYMGAC